MVFEFAHFDVQLFGQQSHRLSRIAAQHFAHGDETRFVVVHHAAVGRVTDFAFGKGIQCIDGFVGRGFGFEMYQNFDTGRGVILYFFDVDFAFFVGRHNGFDKRPRRQAVRYIFDYQRFVIQFFDMCANFHYAAAFAVVVTAHIDQAARRKIGE